ncbi:hypothetical protein BJ508DRAFT_301554 [Ascobolus immersus RN42]|uniref:Uncharacterized protein n=1 Tax=Ascobolus immersus RN42 TaxID=1160509 RepID=A0A3N4IR89_ASCIM|nr:hypothetical protein BJ508DRAFT_301554 [Ascobolus immersus RN42]
MHFLDLPNDIRLEIADCIEKWPDHCAFRLIDQANYRLLTNREAVKKQVDIIPAPLLELVNRILANMNSDSGYTLSFFEDLLGELEIPFRKPPSAALLDGLAEWEVQWLQFVYRRHFAHCLRRLGQADYGKLSKPKQHYFDKMTEEVTRFNKTTKDVNERNAGAVVAASTASVSPHSTTATYNMIHAQIGQLKLYGHGGLCAFRHLHLRLEDILNLLNKSGWHTISDLNTEMLSRNYAVMLLAGRLRCYVQQDFSIGGYVYRCSMNLLRLLFIWRMAFRLAHAPAFTVGQWIVMYEYTLSFPTNLHRNGRLEIARPDAEADRTNIKVQYSNVIYGIDDGNPEL